MGSRQESNFEISSDNESQEPSDMELTYDGNYEVIQLDDRLTIHDAEEVEKSRVLTTEVRT